MANLNGQNIGTNYKGFLNLDSTINTPLDATLRVVTDGMGNNSALSLSTTQASVIAARNYNTFYVGGSAAAAIKVGQSSDSTVNGMILGINGSSGGEWGIAYGNSFLDSTSIFRFNNSTLDIKLGQGTITQNGYVTIKGSGGNILSLRDSSNVEKLSVTSGGGVTSAGDIGSFNYSSYFTFVCAGGALIGAGTNESATAWTINGGDTWLLRLKASGVEKLTFNNVGTIAWGTTASFPAIKRNGAAIDFRLADDSGYCTISSLQVTVGSGESYNFSNTQDQIKHYNANSIAFKLSGAWYGRITTSGTVFGSDTINASAALEAVSTTKGFLPPRMTTTQKNAIGTPATGLVVFDTTLVKLAVYTGAAWETVTSL